MSTLLSRSAALNLLEDEGYRIDAAKGALAMVKGRVRVAGTTMYSKQELLSMVARYKARKAERERIRREGVRVK